VSWKVVFTKQAQKDAKKLAKHNLKTKAQEILKILQQDPLQNPPTYKKLLGDLRGTYARRINIQHRIVYQLISNKKIVKVIRMWTHYE
jgi:Txe/YoeB family toxin of toxin-antitoxin system